MQALLSKEYAAIRRAQIDPNRAIVGEPAPGDPRGMKATAAGQAQVYASPQTRPTDVKPFDPNEILNLTTYLAVVDKDHNMVSITSSLLSGFGSGVVVDKGGFLMNDRMRYFYLDPKNVNSLQPGKRTRQTINPAMALKDGKPWIAFGTPGSDTQPQTQLQFFLNVAEFGMNVQEALEQPTVISNSFRIRISRTTSKGSCSRRRCCRRSVQEALAAKGHVLDIRNVKGVGSVKAILIDPRTGVLMGGVSPTGDSYVMAW